MFAGRASVRTLDGGGATALLRERDFRAFWSGALVSNLGTWMQNVSVPYALYSMTGRATWVGVAAVAQSAPSIVVGPLGGALADRVDRSRFLLVSQLIQVTLATALWLTWIGGVRDPGLLIAIVGVNAVVYGGTVPCWQAFVSDLAPSGSMVSAITLNSAQLNVARAVGPGLAGVVLAAWGPATTFLLNAVSFSAVIAALSTIRRPAHDRSTATAGLIGAIRQGLRYCRTNDALRTALPIALTTALLLGPFPHFLAVFSDRISGASAGWYGVMSASYGIGAAFGAISLAVVGNRLRQSMILRVSLVAFGVLSLVFAHVTAIAPAIALLALIGATFVSVFTVLNTAVQHAAEPSMRARALSVYIGLQMVGLPIGSWLHGWSGDRFGVAATLSVAALVHLALVPGLLGRPSRLGRLDHRVR